MVYPARGKPRTSFSSNRRLQTKHDYKDIETGTIWQQGTGEAVYGKLKVTPDDAPYQQMKANDWLKLYLILIARESSRSWLFPKKRLLQMLKLQNICPRIIRLSASIKKNLG
jgi:hypothetical protein